MNKAVFALADNQNHADRIVANLQREGFSSEDISILFADHQHRVIEKTQYGEEDSRFQSKKKGTLGTEKHTKAPEGGATGATAGGIIGGSLGLLAGIGSLAIPGVGPFIAAGPIMAALSGSAIGGALGLLVGTLAGLGLPEYEAKKYQNELESGHVLLCIHAKNSDRVETAKKILTKEKAKDIATSSEKASSRWS